jgi:hypothetical protein
MIFHRAAVEPDGAARGASPSVHALDLKGTKHGAARGAPSAGRQALVHQALQAAPGRRVHDSLHFGGRHEDAVPEAALEEAGLRRSGCGPETAITYGARCRHAPRVLRLPAYRGGFRRSGGLGHQPPPANVYIRYSHLGYLRVVVPCGQRALLSEPC